MKKIKPVIHVELMLLLLATAGCAPSSAENDNQQSTAIAQTTESSMEEMTTSSEPEETQPVVKSKVDLFAFPMDLIYVSPERSYVDEEGCAILAEFTGNSNSKDSHTELFGDDIDWTNLYYEFKPVEYIYNPYAYDLGEKFTCVTNYMMEGLFKDMVAGDRLIIFVRDKGPDYPEDEYMLYAENIFYTNDGTLFSVLKEDAEYDGMSVEEFKKLFAN